MTAKGKKLSKSVVSDIISRLTPGNLYERFVPDMRRSNQPDMPTTTTNRIWFLSENRFLFFTRGGPVEVTLKPSFVLAGILVCMAGITAIFYSTLVASYSAIEVIRDESIQTAQASSTANTGTKPYVDLSITRAMTWQPYQLTAPQIKQPQNTTKKHSQPFHKNSDIPNDVLLQRPNHAMVTGHKIIDKMPMIINGGKRITLESEVKKTTSLNTSKQNSLVKNLKTDADTSSLNLKYGAKKQRVENVLKEPIKTPITRQKLFSRPETKTDSLVTRAQEFAIAMLPNFKVTPNPSEAIRQKVDKKNTLPIKQASLNPLPSSNFPIHSEKTQTYLQNPPSKKTKPILPDNGSSPNNQITKDEPVLPIVTKAARTKKMLLSFQQEIDYIRSTVSRLGISQDLLPAPSLSKDQLSDDEFQVMMINLAEHRATLRKIPFKPPMLHFYISSDYGKRKHPKTGKTTFHHGIDLAGTWQENVRVTAPGTVIFAGKEGSFGKVVRVMHEYGIATTYAHLARITVRNGDYLSENHIIGKMGNTGKSAGAHLHYEIRVNSESRNPNQFMKIGRQISVAGELRQAAFAE